jgi:hypothetical protein
VRLCRACSNTASAKRVANTPVAGSPFSQFAAAGKRPTIGLLAQWKGVPAGADITSTARNTTAKVAPSVKASTKLLPRFRTISRHCCRAVLRQAHKWWGWSRVLGLQVVRGVVAPGVAGWWWHPGSFRLGSLVA